MEQSTIVLKLDKKTRGGHTIKLLVMMLEDSKITFLLELLRWMKSPIDLPNRNDTNCGYEEN